MFGYALAFSHRAKHLAFRYRNYILERRLALNDSKSRLIDVGTYKLVLPTGHAPVSIAYKATVFLIKLQKRNLLI